MKLADGSRPQGCESTFGLAASIARYAAGTPGAVRAASGGAGLPLGDPDSPPRSASHRYPPVLAIGAPAVHLSAREHQVLSLVAEGCSNKQIARRLGLGGETVKTHLRNIYTKLSVTGRAHAVMVAVTSRALSVLSGDREAAGGLSTPSIANATTAAAAERMSTRANP